MKFAVESHRGVQGSRFAVVEINKTQLNTRVKKIPGISLLNNFQFVEDGVLSWKAYQIGKGHFYPYSSEVKNAQGDTAINDVVAFSSPSGSSGAVAGHPSSSSGPFSCAEDGCVKKFSNDEELQLWMLSVICLWRSKTQLMILSRKIGEHLIKREFAKSGPLATKANKP